MAAVSHVTAPASAVAQPDLGPEHGPISVAPATPAEEPATGGLKASAQDAAHASVQLATSATGHGSTAPPHQLQQPIAEAAVAAARPASGAKDTASMQPVEDTHAGSQPAARIQQAAPAQGRPIRPVSGAAPHSMDEAPGLRSAAADAALSNSACAPLQDSPTAQELPSAQVPGSRQQVCPLLAQKGVLAPAPTIHAFSNALGTV